MNFSCLIKGVSRSFLLKLREGMAPKRKAETSKEEKAPKRKAETSKEKIVAIEACKS